MSPILAAMIVMCAGAAADADKAASDGTDQQRPLSVQDQDAGTTGTKPVKGDDKADSRKDGSGKDSSRKNSRGKDGKEPEIEASSNAGPFDGFGQIAAEMEEVALKQSAKLLKSNKAIPKTGSPDCDTWTADESKIAQARAQVSAVIAKAARPDLVARVAGITDLLQQLELDLEMIRGHESLTPATKALVELSLLKEREALLESAGLIPTPEPLPAQDNPGQDNPGQDNPAQDNPVDLEPSPSDGAR